MILILLRIPCVIEGGRKDQDQDQEHEQDFFLHAI